MKYNINIFDVGARYGVHESWQNLFKKGLCKYYAFEPEIDEYKNLEKKYKNENLYHVQNIAFGNEVKTNYPLNIYKHHGYSSFLKVNENSEWFKRHGSSGELESVQNVKMDTIDNYCKKKNIRCDFLKTDTEGYDLSVFEGALNQLKNIIGIQCEAYFQETYFNAGMFNDVFAFLTNNGFILLNFDYDGKGLSSNYFCVGNKYGTITELDTVFIKPIEMIDKKGILKHAVFCFNNNASDLALDSLKFAKLNGVSINLDKGELLIEYLASKFLSVARKLQYSPYNVFQNAISDYELIFESDFPHHHKFFSDIRFNPK